MSARDDLIRCFERHSSAEVSEVVADRILSDHAHELAEWQRTEHDRAGGCGLGVCCGDSLIDLIDPEVK